jgi:hypothetical protein
LVTVVGVLLRETKAAIGYDAFEDTDLDNSVKLTLGDSPLGSDQLDDIVKLSQEVLEAIQPPVKATPSSSKAGPSKPPKRQIDPPSPERQQEQKKSKKGKGKQQPSKQSPLDDGDNENLGRGKRVKKRTVKGD